MNKLMNCRLLIKQSRAEGTDKEPSATYEIEEFKQEPGVYFEKIGTLQQVEANWKLAIKIDVTTINLRVAYLQKYLEQAEEICRQSGKETRRNCKNALQILHRENEKIITAAERLQLIYKRPVLKRGLIDAIGTVSKTLFGTMDAEDSRIIGEQMELTRSRQQRLEHVVKNQLKIINATIGNIQTTEQVLDKHDEILANLTLQATKLSRQEESDEHLVILNAITADLYDDIKNTIEYLTTEQNGAVEIRLLPIQEIIHSLKEATMHLPSGLHFPFKIQTGNWQKIRKYAKTSAYFDNPSIFSILKFPVIGYPAYEIIKAIPLPVHNYDNIFTLIKITQPLLAINKQSHNFLRLKENDLNTCMQESNTYICEQNLPIYYIQDDAPCEIQMYTENAEYEKNCEKGHIVYNNTVWITLTEPQAWLYSTVTTENAELNCDKQATTQLQLKRTGKIKINKYCKLTTRKMMIITKREIETRKIEAHLPKINLTLSQEKAKVSAVEEPRLKQIIRNHGDLTKYSRKLSELTKELTT